jgi:hypothetical protein
MSVKRAIIMTAAALTLAVGLGTAGALTANAATPSCGTHCTDVFSEAFPGFYWNVPGQVGTRIPPSGHPVNLAPASNTNPGEDFILSDEGTVHDLFLAGLVGAALNARYGDDTIFGILFAPFGAGTDLCLGVPYTPFYGTPVELEPCGGNNLGTVWIAVRQPNSTDFMFVNGSETLEFGNPFVLTAMSPRSDLLLWPQDTGLTNRTVPSPSYQLWGATTGVLLP